MKILVTAGPAWSPIDKVRVITNIFGGSLGYEIAKQASMRGHEVTLLMGPGRVCSHELNDLKVNLIRFKYYKELLKQIVLLLRTKRFGAVIQSAAISDYQIVGELPGKIKSGEKLLRLTFKPTVKIVNLIKRIQPRTFLVKFKLEVNISKEKLNEVALKSMYESQADAIVANDYRTVVKKHAAFIITSDKKQNYVIGKESIARKIIDIVECR